MKTSWLACGAVIGSLIVFVGAQGCGDDDDDSNKTAGASHKGEACQKTSDCAPGLACLPSNDAIGGTCVVGVFSLAPTGKECVRIECQVPKDCCPQPSSECTELKRECDEETDAGVSGTSNVACTEYKQLCTCDETLLSCTSNKCGFNCKVDGDCSSTGFSKCLGGTCGQCAVDTDCAGVGANYTCVNAQCQPPCQTDGDCSEFDRCVSGKCIAGGCQTDRECVYAFRREDATCGTDGKCTVPCQTDTECGDPEQGYDFYKCNAGKCQYIGCQEDKDCAFYLNGSGIGSSSSSSSGSIIVTNTNSHVVCQFPAVPTPAAGTR